MKLLRSVSFDEHEVTVLVDLPTRKRGAVDMFIQAFDTMASDPLRLPPQAPEYHKETQSDTHRDAMLRALLCGLYDTSSPLSALAGNGNELVEHIWRLAIQ